jgi:hypothetical protein
MFNSLQGKWMLIEHFYEFYVFFGCVQALKIFWGGYLQMKVENTKTVRDQIYFYILFL